MCGDVQISNMADLDRPGRAYEMVVAAACDLGTLTGKDVGCTSAELGKIGKLETMQPASWCETG